MITPENKILQVYAEDKYHAVQLAKKIDTFKFHESKYQVLAKRKNYTKKLAQEK
ncbi:MAG: hypothetical protein ACK52I_26000 [Pseudomonadota bacterium]